MEEKNMKKATEILGLTVMGVREGRENGVAQDFMVDPVTKDVKYLILKSNNGYEFRALALTDVMGIGSDYIMTATTENAKKMYESKELLEQIEKGFFLLDTTALSSNGNIMGRIVDFEVEEKTGKVGNLEMEDGTGFPMSKVATLAGRMVFVDQSGEPLVRVATEQEPVKEESALDKESYEFLTGKTLMSDVHSDDGSFMLPAGTILTEEILREAAARDMMLMLTLSV